MASNNKQILSGLSPIAASYPFTASQGSTGKELTLLDFLEHCESADMDPVEVVKDYSAVIRS